MRLCSIINVWTDAMELLPFCLDNHLQFCDHVIVVWSMTSNHGVYDDSMLPFILKYKNEGRITFHQLEPTRGFKPLANETRKRNYGINVAYETGFTHYLIADQDEMYKPEVMSQEKKRFDDPILNGLVHRSIVYVKEPTLWCEDHTLVPGVHKLDKNTRVGPFVTYPYAYDAGGRAHIDPSRRPNHTKHIEMSWAVCNHFSYVRKNIDLKINNSSAKLPRSRQIIYDELRDAKPGYVSKLYHQPLQECENIFNLPVW